MKLRALQTIMPL